MAALKERLRKLTARCALLLLALGIVLVQSSTLAFKVGTLKIDFAHAFIITVMLMGSVNFGLLLAILIGFSYDLFSSNEMGFYMLSYFFSCFPLIFWVTKLRPNLQLSLFLLTVFVLSALKLIMELGLLVFIYGAAISFYYLKGIGLLGIVLTTLCAVIPYGCAKWGQWMGKRFNLRQERLAGSA